MQDEMLPSEVISALNGEIKDFAVKGKRAFPLQSSLGMLGFGLFWSAFISIFWVVFLGPVFQGQEVHFKSNGVPVTAGPGNFGPLMFPAIIIGVFTLIGIAIIVGGIRMLNAPGPWFVATETRLIVWSPKNFRSIDWKDFTGTIDVIGGTQEGDVILEMMTGKMVSRKNGPDQYVPDKLYIVGIANPMIIEESLRKRIKENTHN